MIFRNSIKTLSTFLFSLKYFRNVHRLSELYEIVINDGKAVRHESTIKVS